MDFDRFVVWAVQESTRDRWDGGLEWRSPLWELVRLVRSWFKDGVKAGPTYSKVDRVVRALGGWDVLYEVDPEAAHAEFITSWPKVRYRIDEDPVTQALAKATAHPIKVSEGSEGGVATPGYDRFCGVCGWLQVIVGEHKPIFVPVRKMAELLKTDIRVISQWRQMAESAGFLVKTKEHEFARRQATEFTVAPHYYRWLKELERKRVS